MGFQSGINKMIGISSAALGLFGFKKKKEEKPEDVELKKAKTEYYKQKTESAKIQDKYTKEATKFRKQRTIYQKNQNDYKQLKTEELRQKLAKQQEKNNLNAFRSAAINSMQEVAKKVENQNLVKQNLNNITSEQSPFIKTDGTTTNIATTEEIRALEAKQQREWNAYFNRSQAAKKVWEVKNSIRNLEDVDAQWGFSGNFKEADLKKIGLTKTKLREMDKGGEFEKAQDALASHFRGTETETAILGATNHAELGKAIEDAIYRKEERKAEEDAYWEAKIAEAENIEAIKEEIKSEEPKQEETYSVWPKRDFSVRNTEEKKDFNETRWRR